MLDIKVRIQTHTQNI